MPRLKDKRLRKRILDMVAQGMYQKQIAKKLHISPTRVMRILKELENANIILCTGGKPKFYKLTKLSANFLNPTDNQPFPLTTCENSGRKPKNRKRRPSKRIVDLEPLTSDKIRLHDFKVKIPIARFGKLKRPKKKVKINNWTKRYYNLDLPTKTTMEITTRNVILHFHETDIPRSLGFSKAMTEFATKGIVSAVSYLGRTGFSLDLMNIEVISQHLASTTAKKIDKQVAAGTVHRIMLGYQAKTITGEMPQEGAAWVDKSTKRAGKKILEIETNDNLYEEMLLQMPMRLVQMQDTMVTLAQNQDIYNKNIKKHLEVLDKMSKTLDAIRDSLKRKKGHKKG